jgi:hypothetical protein
VFWIHLDNQRKVRKVFKFISLVDFLIEIVHRCQAMYNMGNIGEQLFDNFVTFWVSEFNFNEQIVRFDKRHSI